MRAAESPSLANRTTANVAPAEDEDMAATQGRHLQDRFAAERVDPRWATTARRDISDDLSRVAGDDVQLQTVECRSSMCRAELSFVKREAGTSFMEKWLRARSWTGPGYAENEGAPDGPHHLVVFLGKPGADLL